MKKLSLIPILIIAIIGLFYSCKGTKQKKELTVTVIKSVDFKTNIVDLHYRFKGLYYDKYLKQDIVYFSDFAKNFIKTFNLQGEIMDSIPLENVIKEIRRRIIFIAPYSRDTIFCGEKENNKIIVINHDGNIYHTININDFIHDSLKDFTIDRQKY